MKIIRNIDGKKLELTLTNEEAMSVFMDVFFDTDKFADYPANRIVRQRRRNFRGAVQAGYFFRAGLRRNTKAV